VASVAANQSENAADPLEALAAENESLRRQLRHSQKLATVGTMTAMIVHEFNNILTPIINYAQLAGAGDEKMVAKAIRKAAEGGRRATDICDALLGLLRDRTAEPVRVNVADMIEQSLLAMGRSPSKDGIELHIDIPRGLKILARPGELKQVIVNLLINARSAILANGSVRRIDITAGRRAEAVVLSVADTGAGIAPEHMARLFEPFFTTKNGETDGEVGSGLGLAFCKEVLTKMDGDIRAESAPGQGATFYVMLPA